MEFKTLSRVVYLGAGIFVALWLAHEIMQVLLLLFFAIVFTIVLNAPTTWLESRRVPRTVAALVVFFSVLILLGLFGWLLIPKIVTQVQLLVANLPQYVDNLSKRIGSWLGDYPAMREKMQPGSADNNITPVLPSVQTILTGIGRYSISLIGVVLLVIFFFCMVVYMLVNPRPLMELYLSFFPEQKKEKAARAFANASVMTIGWMWSNIIAGAIRAVIVWIFLYFMDIPGIWVWAGITFFAELIPKIGFYIMAVPPILIALSIDPVTAMWVSIFYLVLDEIMGDFVIPRIRASTMKLHPVSTLFMLLAMGTAFGMIGALIATPLTAFIKAYYEQFFAKKTSKEKLEKEIELMIYRKERKKFVRNENIVE